MIHPTIYEADEIAQMLAIVRDDPDHPDEGIAIAQEWTPYDALGRKYIVDLPATGQAFLVTVEPYASVEDDD